MAQMIMMPPLLKRMPRARRVRNILKNFLLACSCCALTRRDGRGQRVRSKLEAGDIVSVSHKGFACDSETEEKGRQIDENPKGEPLIFEMGSGSVIRGMEIAMSGMCLGEKILAVLPPATAFDDPERNFQNKPVGDGEHVAYEIKVEDIHRPSAVEKLFSRAYRVWSQVAPFVAIIILVAIFAFFLRVISKMSSKNAVPAKVKRGKKGKKEGQKVRLKI